MAYHFGDHPSVAAFMVAFRFSNLLRRLLGEGPLQSAFIPAFESLRLQNTRRASIFFQNLTAFITFILLCVTCAVVGSLTLPLGNFSPGTEEIINLTKLLFPGIIFICLYGLNISLLNCFDSFFVPSFAPFICNGIWILALFFLRNHDPTFAMTSLANWVVLGFFGQWLITLPLTLKYLEAPWKGWFSLKIPSEVKELASSFSLGAIGVGAVQINALFDAIFARCADAQGPIYLWYSIRLEQLALAIFGIACVTTIVPRLTRAIKGGNQATAQALFSDSLRRIVTIMVPSTFAILATGISAVNLIYGRGHFSPDAVLKTSFCLFAYSLGLVPTTIIILFSSVYYAKGDFKTPLWVALFTVFVNLILNFLFVFGLGLGAISTALSTSLSAWINYFVLLKLNSQMGFSQQFPLSRVFPIVFASFFAFLMTIGVDFYDQNILSALRENSANIPTGLPDQFLGFFWQSLAFVGGFFLYAILFKISDVLELFREILLKKPALQKSS